MRESIASRPEARFALIAGIAGASLAAIISVKAIFGSHRSTADIGFVFVPFVMAAALMPRTCLLKATKPSSTPGLIAGFDLR